MNDPTPLYEYPNPPAPWSRRVGDAIGTIIAVAVCAGLLALTLLAMLAVGDWLVDSITGC